MRRFGGDCYTYGLLASGHVDVVMEMSLEPYDFLALVPVIECAGGVITDWQGRALRREIRWSRDCQRQQELARGGLVG